MQKLLLLAVIITTLCGCKEKKLPLELITFKDESLKSIIVMQFDTDGDSEISLDEAQYITELDISFANLTSLDDIEYFSNLTHLNCSGNELTSLDISRNTFIKELLCSSNQLTKLDLSGYDSLKTLYCADNQIETLDTSNNIHLTEFSCAENHIAKLDITKNTALANFFCNGNNIITIDVSKNAKLVMLNCYNNPSLTTLEMAIGQNISIFIKDDHTNIVYVD